MYLHTRVQDWYHISMMKLSLPSPQRLRPVDRKHGRPRAAAMEPHSLPGFPAIRRLAITRQVLGEPLGAGHVGALIGNAVYERLRAAILDAKILPGASISETELASYLEVSRTPVRAALQRLDAEGLVQVAPQRGTTVARLDLARIQEALFMREAVECAALQRLRLPLPQTTTRRLQTFVKLHAEAAEQANSIEVGENDNAFHRTLMELAGVPGAWRYVLEAREVHRRVRILGHTEFHTALPAAQQHGQIVAAITAGRLAEATEIMRAHIKANAQFANDMASLHPEYFTATSPTA